MDVLQLPPVLGPYSGHRSHVSAGEAGQPPGPPTVRADGFREICGYHHRARVDGAGSGLGTGQPPQTEPVSPVNLDEADRAGTTSTGGDQGWFSAPCSVMAAWLVAARAGALCARALSITKSWIMPW
ncbi:hypothetical protein GCM10027290_66370 [Micromonospora sonneratiae]